MKKRSLSLMLQAVFGKGFSLWLGLCAAVLLLLQGCGKRYEEFYFKGIIREGAFCTALSPSYLVEVLAPGNIGDTVTLQGATHRNCLMAYRCPDLLHVDDTIWGVAYLTEDYGPLNCVLWLFPELPEMCIISATEDPATVEAALAKSLNGGCSDGHRP